MTIDAAYVAPIATPMHTMLDQALTPYLEGDLDASDNLIDALLDIIASAERTPDLIGILHGAVKTLTPTPELMPAIYGAIGAAMEFDTPAPAHTGYGNTSSSRPSAARVTSGTSREGSIGARIKGIFNNNPGEAYRVGDLVKALSERGHSHSGGAVGAALNGMVDRGEAIQVGERPKLYLAADDPEAPQQTPDTAAEADAAPETPNAPAETSAADTGDASGTAAESAELGKTATGTRRGAAKTGK